MNPATVQFPTRQISLTLMAIGTTDRYFERDGRCQMCTSVIRATVQYAREMRETKDPGTDWLQDK